MIDTTAKLSTDTLNQKIKQEEIRMEMLKEQHNHTGTDLIEHLRNSYAMNNTPYNRDLKN